MAHGRAHLHLGHQLEAHRFERLVLGHNGYGSGICSVIAKVKVNAGWRCAHKVATILGQAQDFLLDLCLVGMADPWSSTVAGTALALNECLLLLVERIEYGLKREKPQEYHIEYLVFQDFTHIILDRLLDLAASLADGR